MHKLIAATAGATIAMSIGTGDRVDNEHDDLNNSLALLNRMLNEKNREGQYELAAAKGP